MIKMLVNSRTLCTHKVEDLNCVSPLRNPNFLQAKTILGIN